MLTDATIWQILVGAYLFSGAVGGFIWREMRNVRQAMDHMAEEVATLKGVIQGQNHESRLLTLEARVAVRPSADSHWTQYPLD